MDTARAQSRHVDALSSGRPAVPTPGHLVRRTTAAQLAVRIPDFGPLDCLVDPLNAALFAGRPEEASQGAHRLAALASAMADVATMRFALEIEARATWQTGDTAAARAVAARLLATIDSAVDPGADPGTGDDAWRAVALAHLASAAVDDAAMSDGLEMLARAIGIIEAQSGNNVLISGAALLVASVLARLMLYETATDLVHAGMRRMRALPADNRRRRAAELSAQRNLFDIHAMWSCHLDILGRRAQADAQRGAAASAALCLGRLLTQVAPALAARADALEAFAVERLGEHASDLAVARARLALTRLVGASGERGDGAGRCEPFEASTARLTLARGLARRGDVEEAHRLLAAVDAATQGVRRGQWHEVWRLTSAEVAEMAGSEGAGRAAVDAYRHVAASALERLWQDRQGRLDDLRHRMQLHALQREEVRTARELLMDPLTGLGNRRMLASALRGGTSCGAVFIDVDNFKAINDRWGHVVGDGVLCRMAAVLRSCCRSDDTILRYGGDEFVVLLAPGTPAHVLGERVLATVRAQDWSDLVGTEGQVRVCVGSADSTALDEALRRSDEAVLRAKRDGRDALVDG